MKKVDFLNNERDFACVYYAGIGLSYACIMELTGFSLGQVKWRLKIAKVGPRGYRAGKTPIARFAMSNCRHIGDKVLMKLLS